jgi:hypothetical protein
MIPFGRDADFVAREDAGAVLDAATVGDAKHAKKIYNADTPHESPVSVVSESGEPELSPPVLLGDQRRLYERLADREREGKLAAMYLGGLTVLTSSENPDRVAQAANSMRELMEKLSWLDFGDAERGSMGEQAKLLRKAWGDYAASTGVGLDQLVGQAVGPPLLNVLRQIDVFVSWLERNTIGRSDQAHRVVEQLKASEFSMPASQQRANVKSWMKLRTFLDEVAHHGQEASVPEFRERLAELEEFLLNLWMPDTAGDFQEIDRLLGVDDAE